jgi:hypothetical protein
LRSRIAAASEMVRGGHHDRATQLAAKAHHAEHRIDAGARADEVIE